MNADGSNAPPIDPTIPAQTAVGCTVCPGVPRELDAAEISPILRFWGPEQP